jgi:quercetin dioxygenase-like cupin family protein
VSLKPLFVKRGEGKQISPIGGDVTHYTAVGADTGGQFALLEQLIPPGHGPRRHVHSREEESFYILEGEFTFEVGGQTLVAPAGSFVLGPRGIPHTFWNSGKSDARLLLIISPPGLEPFFEEYSHVLAEHPGDLQKQAEVAGKYGLTFV